MYNELYSMWRREIEETPLGALPSDFYVRVAEYLKTIKEENRALEKKSVKLSLLDLEAKNVHRMLDELLRARYRKLIKHITQNQKLPSDLLTAEELKMCESFMTFSESYKMFTKSLLEGQSVIIKQQPINIEVTAQKSIQPAPFQPATKRTTLRFIKSIPAIIGADMKPYGPFKAEDVASLPADNAKMLVKQGFAVVVEVS